jgi:hypothetical protein
MPTHDPPLPLTTTLHASFSEISAHDWNGLLAQQTHATPFLDWAFLNTLEETCCTHAQTGWLPLPLAVRDASDALVGAAALYAKGHSYGEFVFDWAWAEAYERAGLAYYPKLVVASPFSPIPGTRLLAAHALAREAIIDALESQVAQTGMSSAHVLFADAHDISALADRGWLIRENVQFHWMNHGYGTFEDYLSALTQPKRKKVNAERRKVRDAGITTRVVSGRDITPDLWDFFFTCYTTTYREHHSTAYLSRECFFRLAAAMPEAFVLSLAERDARPIASALLMQHNGVLYGRYWGAVERVDCLHFEVAYYRPIEWAISRGITRFEGGAQGEHKLARGFEPVVTHSAHWLSEPRFRDAVARYLERESNGIERYVNELEARSPIRT